MLSPEERQKIYEEEKERAEAREQVNREMRDKAGLAQFDKEADRIKKNFAQNQPVLRGLAWLFIAPLLGIPALLLMMVSPGTTIPLFVMCGIGYAIYYVMKKA